MSEDRTLELSVDGVRRIQLQIAEVKAARDAAYQQCSEAVNVISALLAAVDSDTFHEAMAEMPDWIVRMLEEANE